MRIIRRVLVAQIMAGVLLVGPVAGTALAKNVAVGDTWTLNGSALGAGRNYTIGVADSGGTTYFFVASDASGHLDFSWHSYYAGTSNATITDNSGRKPVVAATCSFQVV
jgi:hypothetical protein